MKLTIKITKLLLLHIPLYNLCIPHFGRNTVKAISIKKLPTTALTTSSAITNLKKEKLINCVDVTIIIHSTKAMIASTNEHLNLLLQYIKRITYPKKDMIPLN